MEFYEFCLDNAAAPSCTSGCKFYYGTKENFQLVLDNIENVLCNGAEKHMQYLRDVFDEFCRGNKEVENIAGFTKVRFAKSVTVLESKKFVTGPIDFTYINPYQWDYHIRANKTESHVLLIKKGIKYCIVHRTIMSNLEYEVYFGDNSGWATPIMCLGFPGMMLVKGTRENNTRETPLYLPEKEFNSKDEAEEYFLTLKSLDYTLFLQEIFADG